MSDVRLAMDHLVVGALTLEQGVEYVRDVLGVEVPAGGKHPSMGTHNRLMRVGEGVFLEIIAVDPAAGPPARRRWFALDDPAMAARLKRRPGLIAWVAGTTELEASLRRCPEDLGRPVDVRRDDLRWRIAVRDDGAIPGQGALPILIRWPDGPHPSASMTDLGIRLVRLAVGHPQPDRIAACLSALGGKGLVDVTRTDGAPRLEAVFRLADGAVRMLD